MKTRLLICRLFLFGALFIPTTAPAQPKAAALQDVIAANFARWDANKDGKLSPQEINTLVLDPKTIGAEAAAVATIHHYFFHRATETERESVTLSKKQLLAPEWPKFTNHKGSLETFNSSRSYRVACDRIQKAPHKVFAGDAPRLEGIHQKSVGDCTIISMVGACAHINPARIKEAMHPHKDGSCEVVFGSGQRVVVPKLTEAQIAQGTSAGDQGLWLNIMEEAFGQVRFADETKRRPDDLALDTIAHGGTMPTAIRLLTGHETKRIRLNNPKDPDALLQQVREVLKTAQAGKLLMGCNLHLGTDAQQVVRTPGIHTGHAYGVLGIDEKSDKVVVWNPWGNRFTPKKGPPGIENGYPTKGGRFEVPLREFVQIFSGLYYETGQPAKQKESPEKNPN